VNFQDRVAFPAHCRPLPPGYRIVQLDSGHYLWTLDDATNVNGGPVEGLMHWDRWWVRRQVFLHAESRANGDPKP